MNPSAGELDHESRLSRFGHVLAIVSLVYPGLNVFFSAWLDQPLLNRVSVPPGVVVVAFAALLLLLRGAPSHADSSASSSSRRCSPVPPPASLSAMLLVMPLAAQPESVVRGALTFVLLEYAVYVPSTPRVSAPAAGPTREPHNGGRFAVASCARAAPAPARPQQATQSTLPASSSSGSPTKQRRRRASQPD